MATRIQNKRSSILGKRPSNLYLEPGEIALNTNASDPGLFFEANDGSVAKVGPTFVGSTIPTSEVGFGQGEQWYDTSTGTLKVYDSFSDTWLNTISPVLGGSKFVLYVGSDYPEASDALSNDGSSRPFATINRACLEIARRSIASGRSDEVFNAKFTIVLLSGETTVFNEPGLTLDEFETQYQPFTSQQTLTQSVLSTFNPSTGGCLLPRGTSVVGLDMSRSALRPTYYPIWSVADATSSAPTVADRTNVLTWTGDSFVNNLTFKDKQTNTSVTSISGTSDAVAVLTSLEPHGFRTLTVDSSGSDLVVDGDLTTLTYPKNVSQTYNGLPTTAEGDYYVEPITATTFSLRRLDGSILLRSDLPQTPGTNTNPSEYLTLTYTNSSHHRLSALGFATSDELNIFYSKVQRAFATLDFGGTVNNAEVNVSEVEIVVSVPALPTIATNSVDNTAPLAYNVSVLSNWGLNGLTVDGDLVDGFKLASAGNLRIVSIQNDAEVFEVYSNGAWVSLKQAYSTAYSEPLSQVTNDEAINYLISSIAISDLRYFYRDRLAFENDDLTIGLPSDVTDSRHYGIKVLNSASCRADNVEVFGAAVGAWATDGSDLLLTNCGSVYGTEALRSEGFKGIGTVGGADEPDKGFTVKGIRRPANVTKLEVEDENNHEHIYLNANIIAATSTTITFAEPIDKTMLFPYTLANGSAIWVDNIADGTKYAATIIADGDPLGNDGHVLTVNPNSSINGAPLSDLGLPYIRRFKDPRASVDRNYSLWVSNTGQSHGAPHQGAVLRYAEKADPASAALLTVGKQLDPSVNGGWNHVFTVKDSQTTESANNPNNEAFSQVVTNQAQEYYVTISLGDNASPWLATFDEEQLAYADGGYATTAQRPYYANFNDLNTAIDGNPKLPPSNTTSVWGKSKTFEYCAPTDTTYICEATYDSCLDPYSDSYTESSVYARGIGPENVDFVATNVIDYDDGSTTFGILGEGAYASYVDPQYIDPDFTHSKQAMTRFLRLLGFQQTDIDTALMPQRWSSRNIASTALPGVLDEGYALAKGEWPVEFNTPSMIIANSHSWEWPGYYAPAKGLPRYHKGTLSNRETLDYTATTTWGGVISASGKNQLGENMTSGPVVIL